MIIAQAPGDKEDLEGDLFIGPSGQVLDRLLNKARVSREEIFITNLLKCRLPKSRKPKQFEIESCLSYLEEEIQIVDPEILVPLGFYATRSVLVLNKLDFPESKANSSDFFGRLFWRDNKKVYPLPHSAALLYNPSFEENAQLQYSKLQVFKRRCRWYPVCPMRKFYKRGLLDPSWVELYCKGGLV